MLAEPELVVDLPDYQSGRPGWTRLHTGKLVSEACAPAADKPAQRAVAAIISFSGKYILCSIGRR